MPFFILINLISVIYTRGFKLLYLNIVHIILLLFYYYFIIELLLSFKKPIFPEKKTLKLLKEYFSTKDKIYMALFNKLKDKCI